MKKMAALFVTLVIVLTMLCGIAVAEGKNFALVVMTTQSTYWQTVKAGAEAAAAESGDSIYFTAPINGATDINGQVDVMQTCINMNVDGIMLAACDVDALVPITKTAIDAGIPVVVVDTGLNTDVVNSKVLTDNYSAAAELAEKIAADMEGKGKLAVLNFQAGTQTGILRETGVVDTIKAKYPDIEVLETQYYDNDTQKALQVSENLLAANPDIKAFYGCNEYGMVGAGRMLMEKGIEGVYVYGFDFSDDVLRLLEAGVCGGTMVQKPYDMGYIGVHTLIQILDGETVDAEVNPGCVMATPENYQDPDVYSVLYPET